MTIALFVLSQVLHCGRVLRGAGAHVAARVAAPAGHGLHLGSCAHAVLLTSSWYYAAPAFGITLDRVPRRHHRDVGQRAAYNAESSAPASRPSRGQLEAAVRGGHELRASRAAHHRAAGGAHHHPTLYGNAISHCKNSSLASVITVPELMLTAQMIYSSTYRAIEILTVTGAIYLVLTSCLSALQMYGERLTAYEQRGLGEGRRRRLRLDAPLPTMPAS